MKAVYENKTIENLLNLVESKKKYRVAHKFAGLTDVFFDDLRN